MARFSDSGLYMILQAIPWLTPPPRGQMVLPRRWREPMESMVHHSSMGTTEVDLWRRVWRGNLLHPRFRMSSG